MLLLYYLNCKVRSRLHFKIYLFFFMLILRPKKEREREKCTLFMENNAYSSCFNAVRLMCLGMTEYHQGNDTQRLSDSVLGGVMIRAHVGTQHVLIQMERSLLSFSKG